MWATDTQGTSGTCVAGTWELVALTASATIAKGEDFAIVIKYSSGTSVTTGFLGAGTMQAAGAPYRVTNVTGSAVKSGSNSTLLAVGSGATAFYAMKGCFAATAFAANAFNNTNSAARGARFQVPFKCRAVGLRYYQNAAGNHNIVLYDDAGTELSSSSTAKTQANSVSALAQESFFDNAVTLSPATWYRAALEPSSATNCNMGTLQLPSADYRSAMPGGTNFHYALRASGTWDDTETDQVPLLDVLIDQLDDGVGGGGLKLGGSGGLAG